jgi:hypothetical protein
MLNGVAHVEDTVLMLILTEPPRYGGEVTITARTKPGICLVWTSFTRMMGVQYAIS